MSTHELNVEVSLHICQFHASVKSNSQSRNAVATGVRGCTVFGGQKGRHCSCSLKVEDLASIYLILAPLHQTHGFLAFVHENSLTELFQTSVLK